MRAPLLVFLLACKPPADAPAELDELVGYMFDHVPDDEPDALVAGAANMDTWLFDRIDETLEGYRVENLTQTSIDALGEGERDLEGLVGAAVGNVSEHSVEDTVAAAVGDDPIEMYPGNYLAFEREFTGDLDCFVDRDCDWLESEVRATLSYPLGIQVDTESRVQYRWVEADAGPVLVQRTWLHDPAVVSVNWLEVDQQYYLWVVLPDGGGSRAIQATWAVARLTGDSVPEDAALNMVIDSMVGTAEDLDAWVAAK